MRDVKTWKFTQNQKVLLADILKDTANYAIAGLVFGQLITGKIDLNLLILGILLYSWLVVLALRLRR